MLSRVLAIYVRFEHLFLLALRFVSPPTFDPTLLVQISRSRIRHALPLLPSPPLLPAPVSYCSYRLALPNRHHPRQVCANEHPLLAMIHDASVWPSGQEYLRPLICTGTRDSLHKHSSTVVTDTRRAGYLVVLALLAVLFSKRLGALEHFSRIRVIPLLVAILLGAS